MTLRQLHDRGSLVSVENDAVVITLGKTKIHAREIDDLTFIGELYFRNTYNFVFAKPTCVIDVGMNIGLATLFFAAKENVREVHGYEPFPKTFERALANIELNSAHAGKIHANNFGLADKNGEVIVTVPAGQLSGMNSTRSAGRGISIPIEIRDASETFRPIVEKARQSGLSVVAKIDCEGSEFAVFESLESRGLLDQISGLMVEWHRGAAERTQHDLLEPLLRRGFMAFDVSRNDDPPATDSQCGSGFCEPKGQNAPPERNGDQSDQAYPTTIAVAHKPPSAGRRRKERGTKAKPTARCNRSSRSRETFPRGTFRCNWPGATTP